MGWSLHRGLHRAPEWHWRCGPVSGALELLKRRVDIFDEETGNLGHPLFATRL